jgi:hypothetical protein
VFEVGRGDGFVVLAEVTARAASELRLADGGPVWATGQDHRVAGYRA